MQNLQQSHTQNSIYPLKFKKWINKNRILKQCSVNLQEGRREKTKKMKNKVANLNPTCQ